MPELKESVCPKYKVYTRRQCFSYFTVNTNRPGVLLQRRFRFSWSGVRSEAQSSAFQTSSQVVPALLVPAPHTAQQSSKEYSFQHLGDP